MFMNKEGDFEMYQKNSFFPQKSGFGEWLKYPKCQPLSSPTSF